MIFSKKCCFSISYDKYGVVKIKFQNLLIKFEKNDFFEKLGLPAKPDCRIRKFFFSDSFLFRILYKPV